MTNTPMLLPVSTTTAPEGSRDALASTQKTFGFVPNMMATFANSPAVVKGYLALETHFQQSTFQPAERTVILLAASAENTCAYCIAAHSTVAKKLHSIPAGTVAAIRSGNLAGHDRLTVLAATVRAIVSSRGYLDAAAIERFLTAGYKPVQLMELLLGVALKTISNYTEHLFRTEVDTAFAEEK